MALQKTERLCYNTKPIVILVVDITILFFDCMDSDSVLPWKMALNYGFQNHREEHLAQ